MVLNNYMGDENAVCFLYESGAYASTSGTGQPVGLVSDHALKEVENNEGKRYLCGNSRNVSQFVKTVQDVTGTLTYNPQDWKMLAFALGSNVDGGSPSPYSHTMTEVASYEPNYSVASGVLQAFTIEDSKKGASVADSGVNFVRSVNGCMVDVFKLSASEGDLIECSVDYLAQSVAKSSGAITASTNMTTTPFIAAGVMVNVPSGTLVKGVKSVDFELNNNLNGPHHLTGSKVISLPQLGNRDYKLDITADMDETDAKEFYDQYFKGGSVFNSDVVIIDVASNVGSRGLILTCSGCEVVDMDIPSPNEGVQEITINVVPESCSAVVNDAIEKYNGW